jgi:hypothetical protein
VHRDNEAAYVSYNLLSFEIRYEGGEADHAVKHAHYHRLVHELRVLLRPSVVLDVSHEDRAADNRKVFQHDLEYQVIFEEDNHKCEKQSPKQKVHRVQD